MRVHYTPQTGAVKISKTLMAQILRNRRVPLYDLYDFLKLVNEGRITDGTFRIRLHCCPDYRAAYRDVLDLSRERLS